MGLLNMFKSTDINQKIVEFHETDSAVLLDVREKNEYNEGRIPQSINISLQNIEKIKEEVEDLKTPLFVYCRSGNRSGQAVNILKTMGYQNVQNIGGIMDYKGQIEK